MMSAETIAPQFSEQATTSPNGEAGETPKNCRFEWVDELPASAPRGAAGGTKQKWLSAAMARLSERPGTWAMVLSYDTPTTAASRLTSLRKQFPGIQFTSRKMGEKGAAVYARLPVTAQG